jgi:hypothetical protein
VTLRLANCILSLTDGYVEYLLGKLDGITRTLRHDTEYRIGRDAVLPYEISN